MPTFAFIFARGGSKGLPRKNVKEFMGAPLIEHSIKQALEAPFVDEVFVSTDDKEIKSISERSKAKVIERPERLASDTSPEWLSWQHAVGCVQENFGNFKNFISMPTTSPLRIIEDIERALIKRLSSNSDICLAITPSQRNPYFNMVTLNENSEVELLLKNKVVFRRQDAAPSYDITTVVYVTTPQYILSNTGIFDGIVSSIKVPKERAIDIDDIYDFIYAEALLKKQNKTPS